MAFDIVECAPMDETNGFVGLVLVSHSAAIADGLAELVAQVAGPSVPIVAAGGGPDGTLGTDGGRVLDALRGGRAAGARRSDGPRQLGALGSGRARRAA